MCLLFAREAAQRTNGEPQNGPAKGKPDNPEHGEDEERPWGMEPQTKGYPRDRGT